MLVITNQTIGNAMGELVGFNFESTDFVEGERDGNRVLFAETPSGTYVVRNIEDLDQMKAEMERLAIAFKDGTAYDDKNVYVMPE